MTFSARYKNEYHLFACDYQGRQTFQFSKLVISDNPLPEKFDESATLVSLLQRQSPDQRIALDTSGGETSSACSTRLPVCTANLREVCFQHELRRKKLVVQPRGVHCLCHCLIEPQRLHGDLKGNTRASFIRHCPDQPHFRGDVKGNITVGMIMYITVWLNYAVYS